MARNILIFSDGTGQVGGYSFDEDRTNVYKLYRATRVAPDFCIDPEEQVAFYDPGLGSRGEGGFLFLRAARWIYRKASQATGLGLTRNIIKCYAAIIRLAKPGDRIFLFGSAAVPTQFDVLRQYCLSAEFLLKTSTAANFRSMRMARGNWLNTPSNISISSLHLAK